MFSPENSKIYLINYTNSKGDKSRKIVTTNSTFFEAFFDDNPSNNSNTKSYYNQNNNMVYFIELYSDSDNSEDNELKIKKLNLSNISLTKEYELKENIEDVNVKFIEKFKNSKKILDLNDFINIYEKFTTKIIFENIEKIKKEKKIKEEETFIQINQKRIDNFELNF